MASLIDDKIKCEPSQKLSTQLELARVVSFARYHWHTLKWGFAASASAEEVFGRLLEHMERNDRIWVVVGNVASIHGIDRDKTVAKLAHQGLIRAVAIQGKNYMTVTQKALDKLASTTKKLETSHDLPISPTEFRTAVAGKLDTPKP